MGQRLAANATNSTAVTCNIEEVLDVFGSIPAFPLACVSVNIILYYFRMRAP